MKCTRGMLFAMSLALAACGPASNSDDKGGNGNGPAPRTPYDLANRCFVMKPANAKTYVAYADTGYTSTGTAEQAIRFYMKPTGLGSYMFYGEDRGLLSVAAGALPTDAATVSRGDEPGPAADWAFGAGKGVYSIQPVGSEQTLALAEDGTLVLGDEPAPFKFEPATGCTEFPEMPTGIAGKAFKQDADQPLLGFAEVHAHMAMGSEMSDGSRNVGPSAGGVMYGHAVNRYGVSHALGNCSGPHGENGSMSPEWLILDGGDIENAEHDTQGWPTFIDWPQRDSQLHQQMYWRWVERAYLAGLRVMTVHGTNIEALCDIAKNSGNDKDADLQDTDCTDMGVGVKQVEYLYDMENYIDAQNGGPGKGWFRIARDPAEARKFIADGKLAVIPGLEFSNVFGCKVTFQPDGSEVAGCTKEQIDAEIERVWDLGVRQIFAFHDVDSALGGTGIFSSILNYVGFTGTHGFWKTYPCPDGGTGDSYFYDAGAEMESAPLFSSDDPLTQAILANGQGTLPVYGPGRQCNARGTTELGFYALEQMMKKGFVLDIDHAELTIKQDMLDLGAQTTPAYPMLSAHGGHGGMTNDQVRQMLAQGGLMYPSGQNGQGFKHYLEKIKPLWPADRPLAMGYGADANGLANQFTVRGAGFTPVEYPFTLFQGEGWGPQFEAAGIEPLKVELLTIPESGKFWNADEVGAAHYGMIADMVEQVRIEGGEEATSALYNSAEAYLRMWEQTQAASAARP